MSLLSRRLLALDAGPVTRGEVNREPT
jgi:hypothetical protein